jgi:hypothetical protein
MALIGQTNHAPVNESQLAPMRPALPLGLITTCSTLFLINSPDARAQEAGQQSPRIDSVSISNQSVEIKLSLNRPFDWRKMKFVSIKTFQNDPPWFPPTRHQLTFGHNEPGMFEWFQWDFIELGKFEFIGEFSLRATTFGGRGITGIFNPVTNLLSFDGLDYVPSMQAPGVAVKFSSDMVNWQSIDLGDQVPREFNWGEPITLRFSLGDARQGFFMAEIEEN